MWMWYGMVCLLLTSADITHPFQHTPKHPLKVHVWAGISWVGATEIIIFDGIMDVQGYADILQARLLPFLRSKLPVSHRLMQDNDPKHTSRL